MRRLHWTRPAFLLALVLMVGGCESALGPSEMLTISPEAVTMAEGATTWLTASFGGSSESAIVTWTTSDPAVATVDVEGRVTALSAGATVISASSGASSGTAQVSVVPAGAAPASVVIDPASAVLQDVGTAVRYRANTYDADRTVLGGMVVSWTVADPSIATIDANGFVTAKTVGATLIVATLACCNVADTATLEVRAVTVAPPTPQGLVWTDDFETGDLSKMTNGYRWAGGGDRVFTDVARSGTHSMRLTYQGNPDLCRDASNEQRFRLGNDLKEIWLEYYVYLPDGSEGIGPKYVHRRPICEAQNDPNGVGANNKFLALWDSLYNPKAVMVLFETRPMKEGEGIPGDSFLYGLWGTDTRSTGRYNHPGSGWYNAITDDTRGRWIQIRVHVRLADTKEAANGLIQLWADGVMRIDMRNLDLAPTDLSRNYIRNGYVMGWANSGFSETTNVFIDDFSVFASSPGW